MDIGKRSISTRSDKNIKRKQITTRKPYNKKNRRTPRTLPAAYTSSARAYARFNRYNSTVVFQELFPLDFTNGAYLLPMSPTKWLGTRTRSLLQTYGSFRPLQIHCGYQPSVATSQGGVIAIGTVFNGNRIDLKNDVSRNISSIASLANSFISQAFKPTSMPIRLGTTLSRNNYPTTLIDEDDIPFWFVASSDVVKPGYLIISGQLSVHNPMNEIISSVGGSFTGSIIRPTETENQTTLVSDGLMSGVHVGDSIKLMASKELGSTDGNIIYHALEPIVATVKSVSANAVTFVVNQALAAAKATFYAVGQYSTANFI